MNSNIKDIYSLTPAQEGIYFQYLQIGDAKIYHFHSLCEINREADIDLIKKSVELLFLRHPVLKSAFAFLKSTNSIKQVILENRTAEVVVLSQDKPFSQAVLDEIVEDDAKDPLDLQKDLLFKVVIVEFTDKCFMLIRSHHIILDGWCFPIIINDLQRYYGELSSGRDINELVDEINKEVSAQTSYAQYVNWLKKQDKSQASEYWKNLLSDCSYSHIFNKENDSINKDIVTFRTLLGKETSDKIEAYAKKNKVSNNTVFESAFGIALQKFSGSNDILFDKVISGRGIPLKNIENTIGLFVNTVPIRLQSNENTTLADLMTETQNQLLATNKFGILSLSEIYKICNINSRLIDALFVFENYYIGEDFIGDMEKGLLSPKNVFFNEQTEFNLSVAVFKENSEYIIRTSYSRNTYSEAEISLFINAYISILELYSDGKKKVKDISVTDKKTLEGFNKTETDYPKDKCIHEMFEKQVEKTPDKTAIVAVDKTLTYKELNEEANKIAYSLIEKGIGKGDIVGLMLPRKSYLLSALFGILKTGAAYLPIDSELPQERIEYMCKDAAVRLVISDENIASLLKSDNVANPCKEITSDSVCYCIYTSGSTGLPKGACITHKNVVNYTSKNKKNVFCEIIKEDFESVLSVTTVSFDIFVTESLLPLVNGKTCILADEEQSRRQSELARLVKDHQADVLQTTPTKMRSFMSDSGNLGYLKSFKAIILGGEVLDTALVKEIRLCTDAEIYNIYGPVEATVWVSYAKIENADDISIGKPMANTQLYILDKYLMPVPIGVTGELCIAGDGVGAGYLNNPELTAEKFIDNPFGEGKLYRTGDLAYWREDGSIVFVGRKDFQVKIRGLRIELGEIENALQSIEGTERAVVVVRKDKEDRQLICAFYTGEENKPSRFREELGKSLPKYMIPHIFTYLEEMPLTASGKANRNALPEIDLENIGTETECVAPSTLEEIILAECTKKVLGNEKVSVLDNFFDIGGDSLKAIELTAKLEEKGYTVAIKDIFSCKNIRELSKKLETKENVQDKVEYDNVIPATAAQMRVYTAQMMAPNSAMYNVRFAFKSHKVNKERLEKAVNDLIARHESLRTHFENRDGQIVQVIEEKAEISVEDIVDINSFGKAFKLEKAPLVRVGCTEDTIVISVHHIIVDGESMPIFLRELNELYMGRRLPDTVQYGEFAVSEGYTEENESYWLGVFKEEVPVLEIPADYPRGSKQSFKGSNIYEQIDINLHRKIEEKSKERGITPYVYYMACLSILLSKLSGNEDIVVGTPMSGRASRYLDTVGMFVNTVALRNRPEGNKNVKEFLSAIRDSSIEAIDNQNYPFGELVKKLNIDATGRNPLFDIMFAYQSYDLTDITFADSKVELIPLTGESSKCDITFSILPRAEDVVLATEYCTNLFKEERIRSFIEMYISILEKCLDDEKYIKDISVTDKKTLEGFNKTEYYYGIPENATLYSLFEKTAKENESRICIRTAERELIFGELLTASEKLDAKIRTATNEEKSVIAVIAERSIEMYAAIYGIIRGGNAYLPIDPEYPVDRIEYMLKNSGAKVVVAQGKFTALAGKTPCIDMTELMSDLSEILEEVPASKAEADDTAYVIYTSGSTGTPKGAKISHRSALNRILWMDDKYPLEKDDVILQKTPFTFDVSVWEHFWWGMCGGSLAVSKPGEHFLPAKILEETSKNKVTHIHFVPSVFELFLNYLEAHKEEIEKFSTIKYVFLSGESLSAKLTERFYSIYDYEKVSLHNLYGPTECAVDVTYYDCAPGETDPVPIGKPVYNTQIYVVDKYNNPVPMGVTGELCIAGMNVGQGYLNNLELTAEKFIDNPFGEGKLYRTGDLAYWRKDGNIVFAGRKDSQIKLNGQRVEIGEIEAVISSIDMIESVAVLLRKVKDRDVLVAFYSGKDVSEEMIKNVCRNKLPKYMVPSFAVQVERMPLNKNGKLDRKTLAVMDFSSSEAETDKPVNDVERYICNVFENILGEKNVGRNSDFFELGGTSHSMISLLSEDGFDNVSAADFMRNPTPAMLADMLNKKSFSVAEYLEGLYVPENTSKVLIILPFAGGGAEAFGNFVASLKKVRSDIAVYYIRYLHSLEECKYAADEISELLKDRQLMFYSHCVGSAVALQIISYLERKDISVDHYFAAASIPPVKESKRNTWNYVPDLIVKKILVSSGANFGNIPKDRIKKTLKSFRKNTDFARIAFSALINRIKTPTTIILSKKDLFTQKYEDTEKIWKNYTESVENISFIDSSSHYFQRDDSDQLIRIIISDM